jgi:hypothetical protein
LPNTGYGSGGSGVNLGIWSRVMPLPAGDHLTVVVHFPCVNLENNIASLFR